MPDTARLFIACCWVGWAVYWLAMAFTNKRTVEHGGFLGYRLVTVVLVIGLIAAGRLAHVAAHSQIWRTTLAVGLLCDLLVASGVAFTVWARIALGRNWSAEVTFKQDHELIESGPYRLVRHPIYTGLIAMALGTAIAYGQVFGFMLLVGLCGGLWWKARQEEQIMSRHFPDSYPDYRRRVHAIVPFLL